MEYMEKGIDRMKALVLKPTRLNAFGNPFVVHPTVIDFEYTKLFVQFHTERETHELILASPYIGGKPPLHEYLEQFDLLVIMRIKGVTYDMGVNINQAYEEFMVELFGSVPEDISSMKVKRSVYTEAMHKVQDKYGLKQGHHDFLGWVFTCIGRSPMIEEDAEKGDGQNE